MIKYENECVGCPKEKGCIGDFCRYKSVPHYFCDRCKEEVDAGDLYFYDGEQLCAECILEDLEVVK